MKLTTGVINLEDKLKAAQILERYGYDNTFTSRDLYEFYRETEVDLNKGTFRWRVYALKNMGVIRAIKRGVYILEKRRIFEPEISPNLKKTYNLVKRKYPLVEFSIWETKLLHDFMNHQPFDSFIVLEVEREVIEPVFRFLSQKRNNVYLNPNKGEIEKYVLSKNVTIIKPLLKDSPLVKGDIVLPKIEKILVDIFFESELFITYQGDELKNIFERIYSEYSINASTLYLYAKNRGIKDKIIDFLNNHTRINKKYI